MNQVQPHSLFTDFDIDLFKAGKHFKLYEKLGAHLMEVNGVKGVYFAVWAPAARSVSVVGDFNYWIQGEHLLNVRWDGSGIWEGFIPNIGQGEVYKYHIHGYKGMILDKGDPFSHYWELRPLTASIWDSGTTSVMPTALKSSTMISRCSTGTAALKAIPVAPFWMPAGVFGIARTIGVSEPNAAS